ncbi:MAG: hypothetical protein COT85_00220 [Chlamydiae bacterium CG10_big_fil_rev_8_21_14_0_10_42_34]|nr:MAG: hypothetical protein COT85_00220 [Chlamydiae bacterium CG10_big_fil_rev_8_21_14_0_10_42_34]
MKKISVRENGLVGTLFREGSPTSAIVLLGGMSGGMNEERAELLAQNGYTVFSLAYFGAKSLPATLNQVPLEYFEKAFQFLRSETDQIGLWGGSRGAELSLLLGTQFSDQISAIAAHVPSSAVYGALDDYSKPAWTYRNKPIFPNAPFTYEEIASGKNVESAIASTPFFINGMQDKEAFAKSSIPVEKIKCPLLLISAGDDQMWPSALFANQIIDRLKEHRSQVHYTHLHYPKAGHAPAKGTVGLHPVMNRWFVYGGSEEENAFAAKDWWEQTLNFFKERL